MISFDPEDHSDEIPALFNKRASKVRGMLEQTKPRISERTEQNRRQKWIRYNCLPGNYETKFCCHQPRKTKYDPQMVCSWGDNKVC